MTTETNPASATSPDTTALWEDFVDILFSPSAVFARRKMGGFFVPLLVVTLFVGVTFFLTSDSLRPIFDAEFDRAMAARAASGDRPIPPEALAQMRDFTANITRIFIFIFVPIGILLSGFALWLAGKLLGVTFFFRTALVVSAYSQVPRIIESVVNAVQGILLDPVSLDGQFRLTFGPGRFLDPETTSPLLLALVGPLDVFTLWVIALVAIGLSVTTGITLRRATLGAALVWFATVLPRLPGAISQM